MSTAYILIAFAIIIILMVVLISKFKVHAAFGILLAGIALAIALKTPWAEIEGAINSGFSGTIKSVGIVIFLGCVLGTILERTGAAQRITLSSIKLFGEKRIDWGIAFSAFILGIAIWADTVVILLIPIVSNIAVKTKKSMMSLGTTLYLGALVTASLVPPTPGPVSAAGLLGLPVGQAIIWGLIVSVPSVIAATLYTKNIKEFVAPKEEYLLEHSKTEANVLPNIGKSLMPILIPLVLIMLNTGINLIAKGSAIGNFFAFIGSPLAALLSGCILALILTGPKWKSKEVLNDWVESGIGAAAMPIIVTGMGGVLATFVKSSGVADKIAELVAASSIPGILVPILIACLIHVVTGSNALGVMTAAALVQPMMGTLGISPLATFLACGTGALMFKHANSSGFWVTVTMSNMNVNQGIRAVGVASTIAGGTGAI
ncbi:MAG: GntP family permease, partial [Christensenellaceae bacterium]|nr:GntP family permease [Christensenellaceae bacterium]